MAEHYAADVVVLDDRPRPVRDVAGSVSALVGVAGTVVTGLAGFGILTAVQGNAIVALLGLIPGLITGVAVVWSAFRTAAKSEPLVTPISSPAMVVDGELVPLAPKGLAA